MKLRVVAVIDVASHRVPSADAISERIQSTAGVMRVAAIEVDVVPDPEPVPSYEPEPEEDDDDEPSEEQDPNSE